MNKLRLNLMFLVLFEFLVNSTGYAQISSKEIDQIVEETMEKFKVAGVEVGIVKDGEIIHNKGYGVTSIETKEKVNANTRFAIASNSKAFTAAALAILIDDGKLGWDDKVVEHVPEFKMYDSYVTANFTIRDLLTHRSGLGLGAGDLMFFPDGGDFTIDDIVKSFQYQKPVSAFRTKFDYDNLLYIVAGEVIARISGMSWSEFVEDRIMKPLGMNGSAGMYQRLSDKTNVAKPHSTINGKSTQLESFDIGPGAAAGGIYSSVSDLSKWILMQLNEGQSGETQIFSKMNQAEMWKPHTNMGFNPKPKPPYKTHFRAYGLGWGIIDQNGYIVISHTGGLPGMLSKITLIPELDLGVIVLTNTSNGGAGVFLSVTKTIIDSYLGIDDSGWTDKYYERFQNLQSKADSVTTQVWETVKSAKDDHIKVEDFIGIYADNWFGKVEVYMNGNQLWFKSYRSPKLNGPMHYYKANAFAIKWEYQDENADAFAIFSLDEEGKAQCIKMKGISPGIDFSFDFQDLNFQRK